ncbi:MAG: ATP-dependent helicase HrpB [Pseudomonadota bacterium]
MEHCRKTIALGTLPVEECLSQIKQALNTGRFGVLKAPPGAGKTTRVPMALLDELFLKGNNQSTGKKILVLEPRRLAAISCAAYMAGLLNEPLGRTIGYRVRMDKRISPATRIEVITQGVFIRMIQDDPSLEEVGLVIFDEFHERNLHNDLGFALCLESAQVFCEDLRILVMSATMETDTVSVLMGNAPVIVSKGQTYPVETIYQRFVDQMNQPMSIEKACARAIKNALNVTTKDILVFLPGAGEIQRLKQQLDDIDDPAVEIFVLYGNLPLAEQARIFKPLKKGHRKIVLATAIAETSITIDGIGVVIDSGAMRVPLFSAQTGMSRLETMTVSKAAADQRRGRAGRTAPGICYRLWSEYEHQLLKPFTLPEIVNVDLAGLALELAAWGVSDPGQLKWLDLPDPKRFDQAKQLLIMLGGLDSDGRITVHGRQMVQTGIHPRLAHMMVQANNQGQGRLACLLAALLNERDILICDDLHQDPDIGLRLEVLDGLMHQKKSWHPGFRVKDVLAKRVVQTALKLEKTLNIMSETKTAGTLQIDSAGDLLALAFPDRIAQKRESKQHTFLMASGKGAFFSQPNRLSKNEYIVAVHLDGNPKNAKIFMAAPYSRTDLECTFKHELKTSRMIVWDQATQSIQAKEQVCFKRLVIEERKLSDIDPAQASDLLLEQIRKSGLGVLPWTKQLLSLKERAVFLRKTGQFNTLPDLSDQTLEADLDQWLKPFLQGVFSFKQLERIDLEGAVFSLVGWQAQQVINKNAPTHIVVPSGSKKPLRFSDQNTILDVPVLEVRLQEMFSLCSTPRIANHTIAVTLHLLSPAGRPVQITNDLESFWKNTYQEVKKELMGRYPKHFWPEDPLTAVPTKRVKSFQKTKE